jgi:DnaJ-class molecular chaperone
LNKSRNSLFKRPYKYYDILGLSRKATQEEIKKAYRELAKIYHPDVNTNQDTNGKFKLINKAYQVLGNPKSRVDYDQSSAECPICYTHEVINTIELQYRCRHCGCKFDATWTVEIIEAVEIASIRKAQGSY